MNFEELADQVLAIDGSKSRSDVLLDLQYTKNVEETINRIFDSEFLQGVQQHNDTTKTNDALVILDSDDEENADQVLGSELLEINESYEPKYSSDFSDEIQDTPRCNSLDFLDDEPSHDSFEFVDDEQVGTIPSANVKNNSREKRISLDSIEPLSPIVHKHDSTIPKATNRLFSLNSSEPLSPIAKEKSFNLDDEKDSFLGFRLDALESLSPIEEKTKFHFNDNKDGDDEFSYTTSTPVPPQDEERDPFAFEFDDNLDEPSKKGSPKSSLASETISLIDSDSDSEGSLPSMDDFFDKLMTKKRTRKTTPDINDRKGKRRAYKYNISLSPVSASFDDTDTSSLNTKERKKLETQEKKRMQAEERKRVAEEKKRLREEKLEEKKLMKAQKALEKERARLLEKENRLKQDRNEILKEIIVDMHPDFVKTKAGELLKLVLDKKKAFTKLVEHEKHHISWRRIVKSEWNEETLTFVPYDLPKIIKEPYILVYVDILDFVQHVKENTMNAYIDEIQITAQNQQVFFLVEGLEVYYKKKLLLQRRQFDNQIRSTIEGTTMTAQKKKVEEAIINGPAREEVEECINYLQLMKDIMFVFTKNDEDTASWLDSLTTDLGLRRYKLKNANNGYKVGKAGTDPSDNYSKMLQEIQLCTPAVAQSVINAYPTLQSLHQAYEHKQPAEGEILLANLEVERSVLNARDRKINRVMSKKIYNIFNCTDPNQILY